MGRSERAVATDNDECVEAISFYAAHHRRNAAVVFLRVEAGASQYRAAALQDALRLIRRQRREFVLDNASPSVVKSEEFVAVRRPRANGDEFLGYHHGWRKVVSVPVPRLKSSAAQASWAKSASSGV